jgi:hypothetical protein
MWRRRGRPGRVIVEDPLRNLREVCDDPHSQRFRHERPGNIQVSGAAWRTISM